jgi:drug/metabolite transporter (DMT)-like permease
MAGDDGPRRIVDCAGLYRIFSGVAALGLDQRHAGALLIPVTAILLGYLVLGESISPREIVGPLVIGSALLLIDGRVLSFVRRVPAIR